MVFYRDRRIMSLLDRIGDFEISKLGNTLCDLSAQRMMRQKSVN